MTSDSIWRLRFERRFCRDEDEKLKLASNWKQLYKWQCCEMLYSGKPLTQGRDSYSMTHQFIFRYITLWSIKVHHLYGCPDVWNP